MGNATWNFDNKPYNLTLSIPADLLDMGASSSWVLLASAFDATNLNSKLVLDLAGQSGLSWSADAQYVDLYLNGEYNGLYTSWNPYVNRAVVDGQLSEIPPADTVWLDAKTGKPFDFQTPITEDVILVSEVDIFYYEQTDDTPAPIRGKTILTLSFVLLAIFFCLMVSADMIRAGRKRSVSSQQKLEEPSLKKP